MSYPPPSQPNEPQWGPSRPTGAQWGAPDVTPPAWQGGAPMSGPMSAPMSAQPVTGYPVTGYPVGGYPGAPPPPPKRPRRLLWTMVSLCVVLAVAFAGTAYYFFFSGADPESVATEYVDSAIAGDYAHAKTLACDDAASGVRFDMDPEGMDAVRRWFNDRAMTWSIRDSDASGSTATVTADVRLMLPNYDGPVDSRWDFKMERRGGDWRICAIQMMTVVDSSVTPGKCLLEQGFQVVEANCWDEGALSVMIEVYRPADCPASTTLKLENDRQRILCVAPSPE